MRAALETCYTYVLMKGWFCQRKLHNILFVHFECRTFPASNRFKGAGFFCLWSLRNISHKSICLLVKQAAQDPSSEVANRLADATCFAGDGCVVGSLYVLTVCFERSKLTAVKLQRGASYNLSYWVMKHRIECSKMQLLGQLVLVWLNEKEEDNQNCLKSP